MATPMLFPESEIKADLTPKSGLNFTNRDDLEAYRINKVKLLRARTDMTWKEKYAEYVHYKHWSDLRSKKLKLVKLCQRCNTNENLRVHHVNYKSWYDCTTDDLEVLCESCHDNHHSDKRNKTV